MKPEQAALADLARESIRAARLLEAEGLYGFAVSRAYFAMFYLAEALLLGEGLAYSKHSAVIAAFGRHLVKSGRLGSELHVYRREAQDQRNRGDYGTGDPVTRSEALEQVRRAEVFLKAAEQVLSPPSSS